MNYLTTLLTLVTLLSTQAATSSLVGGVRVSTDTTGTNTIAANVIVTNLNGGSSRTAIMARDVQVTNAVKVLSLTGNRVVGIGTDKALTNTTVSIATLEALSTAGTNNWINSGTTNSTLAGTAYPWAVEATNHVNVGASGEAGVILFTSTNGTYTASICLLADGTLVVTNNGVLVATIALVSGHDGSTNKFLSAAGTYLPAGGDTLWTNIAGTIQPILSTGVTNLVFDTTVAVTGVNLVEFRNNSTLRGNLSSSGLWEGRAFGATDGSSVGNYYAGFAELDKLDTDYGVNSIGFDSSDGAPAITMASTGETTATIPYIFLRPAQLGASWSLGTVPFMLNTRTNIATSNIIFGLGNNETNVFNVLGNGTFQVNDGGTLKTISFGVNDSGGAGFKVLRISN